MTSKSLTEFVAHYMGRGACSDYAVWADQWSSTEEMLANLPAEYWITGAQHFVKEGHATPAAGRALVMDLLATLTLRPVNGQVADLVKTIKSRLEAPAEDDALKHRVVSCLGSVLGVWNSLGQPAELELRLRNKLRAFVDFEKVFAEPK